MIQTSDKFKENIRADTELIRCKAELSFVPPGIMEGLEISATEAQEVSQIDQLKNGSFGMDANWGTLEWNRIALDGRITFIPEENERQIGFFSKGKCDENGVFETPEQVTYQFNTAYDIVGISIAFDDQGGEWATAFDLITYDADGNEIQTTAISNTKPLFYADLRQRGVKAIVVSIREWSRGLRYCKISQLVPGIVLSFDAEGIYEFSFEERIDPFSSSVTFPETTLVFDNTDNEFNIINPDGLISYLRQKMKTVPKLELVVGARTESIGMGQFYLYSFPQTNQKDEATVICRPSIAFEKGNYVDEGTGQQTVEEAVAILFANVAEDVVVDEELKGIQVNQHIGDDVPIHTAMAHLAIACCGYWKFERDGSYSLKKWKIPEVMLDDLDYDNIWSKPSISMGEKYTSCKTKYYTWDTENEIMKGTDVTVTAEENDGTELGITSYFICSEAQAQTVAQAYLDYKNLRLSHAVQYRGDMSLEAGDAITIQNDFVHSEVVVMIHTLTFDAEGLTGSITGKGLD